MADSEQRGRADEPYFSSGRGGAGNIRRTSASRDRPTDGPEDFSRSRGREFETAHIVTHSGRGGAGNVRTPSRDPGKEHEELERERKVIEEYTATHGSDLHSTGRGGVGNIGADRSRSRGRDGATLPPSHTSSGRGGVGNIEHGVTPGRSLDLERLEEEDRRVAGSEEGHVHSTGRGGVANLSHLPTPHDPHGTAVSPGSGLSSGRGGVGNIHHSHPDHHHHGEVGEEHPYRGGIKYE